MSDRTVRLSHAQTSLPFRLRAAIVALSCATAPAVWAQAASSVQVFGTLDLNVSYTRTGGQSITGMEQGGNIFPSRLGFRGTEDLGSGLSAGFWIESDVLPDIGGVRGAMWQRRSTVSLVSSTLGEIRLGRDYSPTFWNLSQFSPMGTVGASGSALLVEAWPFGVGGARTLVRSNNSVGYFLPRNLGGVYGQAMVALSEGATGAKYTGARVGYASGPVDVALAYGRTPVGSSDTTFSTIGGTYDFRVAKVFANYFLQKATGDEQAHLMLGVSVPVGVGTIKLSMARADRSGPGDLDGRDADQVGAMYVHQLSKRTAVYGTISRLKNKGQAAYILTEATPPVAAGASVSALQIGLSHNF